MACALSGSGGCSAAEWVALSERQGISCLCEAYREGQGCDDQVQFWHQNHGAELAFSAQDGQLRSGVEPVDCASVDTFAALESV